MYSLLNWTTHARVSVSHKVFSSTVWTLAVLYPCLRRPGRETDPSPPSSVEVKNECPHVCLSIHLHALHRNSSAWQVPFDNETFFIVPPPPASVYLPILVCVQRIGRWFSKAAFYRLGGPVSIPAMDYIFSACQQILWRSLSHILWNKA